MGNLSGVAFGAQVSTRSGTTPRRTPWNPNPATEKPSVRCAIQSVSTGLTTPIGPLLSTWV